MKRFILISLLFLLLTAVSCTAPTVENGSEAMYASLVEQADVVFVGRVDFISSSTNDAYQQVAFTVTETIVDDVNVGSGVVLTAVPSQELFVGNEFIVFANQEIMETGSGKTAVLRLIQSNDRPFVAVNAREAVLKVVAQ